MKKQLTILCALAVATLTGISLSGCTQEETVATGGVATGLMANSMSSTSVGLRWTRNASDAGTDRVIVRNNAGIVVDSSMTASGTGASATVTNLTASGGPYTFAIRSDAGTSAMITWSPATRTSGIKLWEQSDLTAGHYSALHLNGAGGQAEAISFTGSNLANTVDLVVDTVGGSNELALETADVWKPGFRVGMVSDTAFYFAHGLDDQFLSKDLSQFAYNGNSTSTTATGSGSKIKFLKTADGNYARIEIVPDATTGKLYSTSNGYRYITVNVSYQSMANTPYASRPTPHVTYPYPSPRRMTQ